MLWVTGEKVLQAEKDPAENQPWREQSGTTGYLHLLLYLLYLSKFSKNIAYNLLITHNEFVGVFMKNQTEWKLRILVKSFKRTQVELPFTYCAWE